MKKKYGLIVIGGGMTGLSTALAWAKTHDCTREPVLILEKEPKTGGCVTTFAREGFRFDTVQIIPEISDVLAFFGIEKEIELIPYSGYYARLFLADTESGQCSIYSVPSSDQSFETYLCRTFPDDAGEINRFFRYGRQMLHELVNLKTEPNPLEGLEILFRCPHIIKQSGKTYRQYLDNFRFHNSHLIEILDMFSSFSGLSGNRCAALLTACAMMTTLQGSYRPAKGFIHFPKEMTRVLNELGGEVKKGESVEKILVDKGKVCGVVSNGREFYSSHVVSTADSFKTAEMLSSAAQSRRNRWFRKLDKARPSPSSFTVHLGLDDKIDLKERGFDCGYNVLTTGRQTHEKCFDDWEQGKMFGNDRKFHMAVISPSALTGGKSTLIIHVTPAPMADWEELRERDYQAYCQRKEERARYYIDKVEQYMIPGLRKHILFTDVSTPATYSRYLGTTEGANSQMLSVPSNFGMFRLPTRTPVKGLFLPKFSHGIWPCLQAGLQTVDMITGGSIMGGRSRYIHDRS